VTRTSGTIFTWPPLTSLATATIAVAPEPIASDHDDHDRNDENQQPHVPTFPLRLPLA